MQNFYSLASTQTDITKIWIFFHENFKKFQKILKQVSKNSKSEYAVLSLNWQSIFMPNFSSPASTQTDLNFFDHFSSKFQNFSEELLSEF
jgi:hypothetical protein